MLEQSLGELQLTVDELEKRIEGLDDESMLYDTTFLKLLSITRS